MTSAGLVADKPVRRCKEQHEEFFSCCIGQRFFSFYWNKLYFRKLTVSVACLNTFLS